jgi:hypothetical protein
MNLLSAVCRATGHKKINNFGLISLQTSPCQVDSTGAVLASIQPVQGTVSVKGQSNQIRSQMVEQALLRSRKVQKNLNLPALLQNKIGGATCNLTS